ncbi:hypothetical protein BD324DRAFT_633132 [Kockovaella imperatae]|uniref:Phosphatidic acid phosphatase type 2/haloperoxidase domain-containing protein n=1 Tax=Kockovaella imperatae TaxID=4999 RepID=A0A1Y1UCW0_9TREE|nr:hypothetical protein BD324DRAFT_633132 [Kockovaella imperatae]ORX34905.1 hypothetical protein BD324DRAFT_633132 [Kockovaella imperatae]
MGLHPHSPSDYPSFLLYVLDETHLTITVLHAAIIIYTRDAHIAWIAVGALGSSLSAKGIKHFIRSPRPPPPPPTSNTDLKSHVRPKKTYGMPSTHSTALSFYFFYLVPELLLSSQMLASLPFTLGIRIPLPASIRPYIPSFSAVPKLRSAGTFGSVRPPRKEILDSLTTGQRWSSAIGITAYWLGGLWSRIELGYHTYSQVVVGAAFGWLLSTLWRGVWIANPALGPWLQGWIDTVWNLGRGLLSI